MGKQIRYTLAYKRKTVQSYLRGDLSANQLALNLGIHPHTVRHWIQEYNDGKLQLETPLDNDQGDLPIPAASGQREPSKGPDIGPILSKISGLEFELESLKAMLQAYLCMW